MTRSAFTDLGATHVQMDAHRRRALLGDTPHKSVGHRRSKGHLDDNHLVHIQRPHRGEQSVHVRRELLAVRRVRSLGHH